MSLCSRLYVWHHLGLGGVFHGHWSFIDCKNNKQIDTVIKNESNCFLVAANIISCGLVCRNVLFHGMWRQSERLVRLYLQFKRRLRFIGLLSPYQFCYYCYWCELHCVICCYSWWNLAVVPQDMWVLSWLFLFIIIHNNVNQDEGLCRVQSPTFNTFM